MLKKIYNEIKKEYKRILVFIIIFLLCIVELPFYIETPGGAIAVNDRIKIEGSYESTGSFNLAYVSELKATIPTLLYSLFNKDWDVLKKSEVIYENETEKESSYRDKMFLEQAKNNSVIVAYKYANKRIEIFNEYLAVAYIDDWADTDLKIGDEILELNDIKITKGEQVAEVLSENEVGSRLKILVKRNDEEVECYGVLIDKDNKKMIGIGYIEMYDIETEPQIEFAFKNSESGPSGGLVLALSIYDHLVSEDITKGRKIVGTGTIDVNGNVGSIGGVEYKIKGAVKEKADIFLVPAGENYEEAKKVIEENNYNIELIAVSTFSEALEKLK